jgi:hypothetical protein
MLIGGPLAAQDFQRRAVVRGGGSFDSGQCVVEVVVDGAAEVEIRGETGHLRNLSGQPPHWRRFECTGVMPPNPVNFRFRGVDGRGRQDLIRDPRGGGPVVVRIEDRDGGDEAYTFEVSWGGAGSGPIVPDGQGWFERDRRDDRYDRDGRFGDRDRVDRRFTAEQAVEVCRAAVLDEAFRRFRTRRVEFRRIGLDNNPGRNDWVVGILNVRRGWGRSDNYRFSCSVNFNNGRVRSAQIEQRVDRW